MDFPLCLSDEVLLTLTGDSRNAVSPLVTAELLSKGLGSGAQHACVCVCSESKRTQGTFRCLGMGRGRERWVREKLKPK